MNRAKAVFMLHGANLIGANVIILVQLLLFWCKFYYFGTNVIILMRMLLFWRKCYYFGTNVVILVQMLLF